MNIFFSSAGVFLKAEVQFLHEEESFFLFDWSFWSSEKKANFGEDTYYDIASTTGTKLIKQDLT